MTLFYILGFYLTLNTPHGWGFPRLRTSYVLFGPSITSLILLSYIGGYLLYRYHFNPIGKSESFYQLSWGLSFLVYAILFLGLCLQALSVPIADMTKPELFFIWRFPMILWVSGTWVGTSLLVTDNSRKVYISGFVIDILGGLWFVYGLLYKQDISLTMYTFLYFLFIPICFGVSYFWWRYSHEVHINSAKFLSLGFFLMGLSYATWAPWHFQDLLYLYYIFYQFFILSLCFVFAGFYGLPKDILIKYSRE